MFMFRRIRRLSVIGMFTPHDSQKVADSFAAEESFFNATHLFVCTQDGCCRRFASHAWLAHHLKNVHGIILAALNASEEEQRKDLMEKQKAAKQGGKVAAGAAVTHQEQPEQPVADLPGDELFECQCWYSTDHPVCGTRWYDYHEIIQHYWSCHPHALNAGLHVKDLETGQVFQPEADYVPMSVDVVTFLKAVVPDDYCEDAFTDAYQWLQSFLNDNGDENGVCNISCESLVREYSASKIDTSFLSPSPVREAAKKRRCSKCNQVGHQKNSSKCSMRHDDSLLLTPDSKRNGSVNISPRTPATVLSARK